jgi:DmsE family decaheme c-type cytochrome
VLRTVRSFVIHFSILLLAVFSLLSALSFHRLAAQDNPRLSKECFDCHDESRESLVGTVHEIDPAALQPRVWCSGCHPGAEQHMEDPETHRPANPASAGVLTAAQICSGCHTNSHQQNMQEWNVHAENGVNCGGCHQVHSNRVPRLLKKSEPGLCIDCHPKTEGDFARSFRHPVFDGVMRCTECHFSLDKSERQLGFRGTGEVCFTCHNEFQGPFPFEHQATVYYSTEEGGCLNCHEAHGSNVPRMLKQSYEPPNFALCSQCHVVPPKHQMNSFHDSRWAGRACNECHTDIHGSYFNRFFLSPVLEAEGCGSAGCHEL